MGKPDHLAKKVSPGALETQLDARPDPAALPTLDGGVAIGAQTPPPMDPNSTLGAIPGLPADPSVTISVEHISITSSALRPLETGPVVQTIGPYNLLKTLGEGGMGQVWLAEQTAPVRRLVALKLIKGGMYDQSVIQRFDSERQSLAIMDHPAIAKVFDAGTSNGQPYFVMEYVPGVPVTEFCDQKRLTPRERLKLFIKICGGVQHAHQKAVIHRDLKPSNILISDRDGKPAPHIIDFGIAKATTPGADQTLLTQVGSFVGTPGYMSPEQADSNVKDIDTRADVYPLGVILYEMLTGCLPFDVKNWVGKPLHEVLRQIREDDPPRPSVKLTAQIADSAEAAAARRIEPRQLVNLISGDLDWITMKALEKDRARRYDSPNALAADIQRYLDDEPVLASPPSVMYRTQKFVRRHRIAVLGAATVGVMLVVLAVSMTVQAIRIAHERDRANREAAAAKTVSDFLTNLFKVSDPSQARGNTITAREILDKGSKQIETGLSGQPEVQARLMATIGNVYQSLGLYPEAQPLLEKALATRQKVLGPQNPETLNSMDDLAGTLRSEGRLADSEKLLRQTLGMQRLVLGPENPATLTTMVDLGNTLVEEGHIQEAEALRVETLAIQQRVLGPDHPDTLRSMNNLADTFMKEGHFGDAEKLLRQTLEIKERTLGADHPNTLKTKYNLAGVLEYEGHLPEAEKLQRETLESRTRILGADHPDTLSSMDNLANILQDEGRLAESEALHRQTLELQKRVLGPDHAYTLASMSELANTLSEEAKYAEADKLLRDTLAIQARILGPDHPDTAGTEYNLACNAALSGKKDEAIALLTHALNHGLSQASAMHMEKDSDLRSLRGDPRFIALVAEAHKGYR